MNDLVFPAFLTEEVRNYYHRCGSVDQTCDRFKIKQTRAVVDQFGLFCPLKTDPVKVTQAQLDFYRAGNSAAEVAAKFGIVYSERYRKALAYLGGKGKGRTIANKFSPEVFEFYKEHTGPETQAKFGLSAAELKSLTRQAQKGMGKGGARPGAGKKRKTA